MPPRSRRGPRVEEQTEGSVGNPPPPPPPPPPAPQPNEREYIKAFRKENPPKFDGLGEPPKAEAWIRDLERIFDFMGCTEKERLTCVTYQLTGPADFWWETKWRTMNPARREALTWEEFKEDKYVPMSYRRSKIMEFHTLKQGSMTVTEYDRALCEITRYAPELVDTDEKMAARFCSGLRSDIRAAVASRRGIPYSEVLACALDVEEALPKNERATNPAPPHSHRTLETRGSGKEIELLLTTNGVFPPFGIRRTMAVRLCPILRETHRGHPTAIGAPSIMLGSAGSEAFDVMLAVETGTCLESAQITTKVERRMGKDRGHHNSHNRSDKWPHNMQGRMR